MAASYRRTSAALHTSIHWRTLPDRLGIYVNLFVFYLSFFMHSIVLAFGRDQPRWSLALSLPGGPECPVSQGTRGKAQRSQCHHVTKGGPRLVTSVRAFGLVILCRRSLHTGAVVWVSLPSSSHG